MKNYLSIFIVLFIAASFTYAQKPNDKIAAAANVKFKLGTADLTFTPGHLALFRNFLAVSDVH